MSTTVTYKGSTLTTVNNQTRVLDTAGTWLEDDITLVDVSVTGDELYLYLDADGYIHTSDTPPTGEIQKLLVVIIKEEYDYTYNSLIDSDSNYFVDSNGNQFLAAETE